MSEDLQNQKLNLGNLGMKFYQSHHEKIHDTLTQVKVRDIQQEQSINVTTTPATIYIGKNCEEYDFCMFFLNFLVKGEVKCKTTAGQIALKGNSDSAFEHEKKKAINGKTTIKGRKQCFLMVTNARMTEKGAPEVVNPDGMFVNAQRWIDTFTELFWWMEMEHEKIEHEKIENAKKTTEKGTTVHTKRKRQEIAKNTSSKKQKKEQIPECKHKCQTKCNHKCRFCQSKWKQNSEESDEEEKL